MERCYSIIEQEQILLEYTDLSSKTRSNLYGLYLSDGYGCVILLDKLLDKPENRRLHRCVLSEELGHHFTAPRNDLPRVFGSCSLGVTRVLPDDALSKVQIAQDERKALEWATNFLMPNNEFNKAVAAGCRTVYDLAEWFDVTEWFVYRKLGIIKARYREIAIKFRARDYFKVRLL